EGRRRTDGSARRERPSQREWHQHEFAKRRRIERANGIEFLRRRARYGPPFVFIADERHAANSYSQATRAWSERQPACEVHRHGLQGSAVTRDGDSIRGRQSRNSCLKPSFQGK